MIRREEKQLERIFGEEFVRYKGRVDRWLRASGRQESKPDFRGLIQHQLRRRATNFLPKPEGLSHSDQALLPQGTAFPAFAKNSSEARSDWATDA
jgi:hypothetical protein